MVCSMKLKREIETFVMKYEKKEPYTHFDDKFRDDLNVICHSILHVEIKYSTSEIHILIILKCMFEIMRIFYEADAFKSLCVTDYILFLKFCQLVTCFKRAIKSENLIESNGNVYKEECMLDYEIEQYVSETYKIKLKAFKTDCSEKEILTINKNFTYFLLDYVKMLSSLRRSNILGKAINLLFEVADFNVLVENIHHISRIIYETKNMFIWKSITKFCIDKPLVLKNSKFINSKDDDLKLEACIMIYYTLQHICEYLKCQKIGQTSQILSMFTIEDFISFIESVKPNEEFEKLYEESTQYINFKTYKKIKTVSSAEIIKCFHVLQLLLKLFDDCKLYNCPFALVILSMLHEFVLATDLDSDAIMNLINLANDYLEICKLPSNFTIVSYAFKMYQKLKFVNLLKIKWIHLCKCMATNVKSYKINQNLIDDLERVINIQENWFDKSVIISHFLRSIEGTSKIIDENLTKTFCILNEQIITFFHEHNKSMNSQLILPYSVSLNFSISNENKDCLFNNLAVLNECITICFDEINDLQSEDKTYFILTILQHYKIVAKCLPDDFLLKCCKLVLNPLTMEVTIFKLLLKLMPSDYLLKFIDMLKIETLTIIKESEMSMDEEYNSYLHQIWSYLLNMQLENNKKKVRKDTINHFCFIINKTFLFRSKVVQTEQGLTFLLKLMSSLLKVSWVNTTLLINCSLRILTFINKLNITDVQVFIEAIELLIVLYKCPNNAIKPTLGLYVASFSQLFRTCWSFVTNYYEKNQKEFVKELFIPFHKFEKCSSLFKKNKSDFNIICQYFVESMVEYLASNNHLPVMFMRQCYSIIFNIMDVCPHEEMKQVMLNIQGPALLMLNSAYNEYTSFVRFGGRI